MKLSETRRCDWCHRPLEERPGVGRPRRFCSPSHRQRAYEARRRAEMFHLPAGEVIVSEDDLRWLHDRLYQLESAVEDVKADLGTRSNVDADACRAALNHLLEAANDLVGVVIEPARL